MKTSTHRLLFSLCLLTSAFTYNAYAQPAPEAPSAAESPAFLDGKKKGAEVAQALIQLDDPQLIFGSRGLAGVSFQFEFPENLPLCLEKKYGIKCLTRALSLLEDFDRGYVETFNQAMLAHLEIKHGKGLFFSAFQMKL